jgi:hypothetical protein
MSPNTERDSRRRNRDPAVAARIRKTVLLLALAAVGVYLGFILWTGVSHPGG